MIGNTLRKFLLGSKQCFKCHIRKETTVVTQTHDPLKDNFGRRHTYLRISLSEKCNLRCLYCMPAEGVKLQKRDKILSTQEIVKLVEIFSTLGVNKVRLTGGEPTVRRDLEEVIKHIKSIENIETVAITTNGLTLTRQLPSLQRAGLDAINISLDTLKPDKFEVITRRQGFNKVIAGIDLALQLNYSPVKINCVVMKDFNEDEMCDFVEFTKDRAVDVRFIEFMPFTGNKWDESKLVSYKKMVGTIRAKWPNFAPLHNGPNDVAKEWKVPEFKGTVGFITSMTNNFCSTCNRIRITADGNLKVCLFGNAEISLRDAMRQGATDGELTELISSAIKKKHARHADNNQQKLSVWNISNNIKFTKIINRHSHLTKRLYTTSKHLTHVDNEGKAKMVDVSQKDTTARIATASAIVHVGERIIAKIKENQVKKGDVFTVAQIAGIMAAKNTSNIIPLCHPLSLSKVDIRLKAGNENVYIYGEVKCEGKTGIEMEVLTAVSVAALTVYDMCKAMSHEIVIKEVKLLTKSGGKSLYKAKDYEEFFID